LKTIGEQDQSASGRIAGSGVVSDNEDETTTNERGLAMQAMQQNIDNTTEDPATTT